MPGLMRWNGTLTTPVKKRLPASKEPWLLFLHGTFSNTQGSFGQLAAQPAQWRRLQAAYTDRILALDHHTLSRSPIDNASEALSLLPDGAVLHLVGYSCGGLIGELLCRGALENRAVPVRRRRSQPVRGRRAQRAAGHAAGAGQVPDDTSPGHRSLRARCLPGPRHDAGFRSAGSLAEHGAQRHRTRYRRRHRPVPGRGLRSGDGVPARRDQGEGRRFDHPGPGGDDPGLAGIKMLNRPGVPPHRSRRARRRHRGCRYPGPAQDPRDRSVLSRGP